MDIKENNILITHCEQNLRNPLTGFLPIKFKLADFGISVSTQNMITSKVKIFLLIPTQKGRNKKFVHVGQSGTHKYMAPEQFQKKPYDPFKAEVYSMGMFLFHLIFKAFPFKTNAGQDPEASNPDFL